MKRILSLFSFAALWALCVTSAQAFYMFTVWPSVLYRDFDFLAVDHFDAADINNAGNICGAVRRPATLADGTTFTAIYRSFRLSNIFFTGPIFP